MNSFYKGLIIFCSGLGFGLVVFSGQGSKNTFNKSAYEAELLEQVKIKENARQELKVFNHPYKNANLDKPVKTNFKKVSKKINSSQEKHSKYYASSMTDQIPTAPPGEFGNGVTKMEPPKPEDEEKKEEDEKKQADKKFSQDEVERLLQSRLQEMEALRKAQKKKSNEGSSSFSSVAGFGVYDHYEPEENKAGGINIIGGGGGGGSNGNVDVSDLPTQFTSAGANIANQLLTQRKISMSEYIEYMSSGLESSSANAKIAINHLSAKNNNEAFAVLAQFSASTTGELNSYLDTQLSRSLKNATGLKFLSGQIANTEHQTSSRLAINTIGFILEGGVSPSLYDVLKTDVYNSLNNLPSNHPDYELGRRLAALIPTLVNS